MGGGWGEGVEEQRLMVVVGPPLSFAHPYSYAPRRLAVTRFRFTACNSRVADFVQRCLKSSTEKGTRLLPIDSREFTSRFISGIIKDRDICSSFSEEILHSIV